MGDILISLNVYYDYSRDRNEIMRLSEWYPKYIGESYKYRNCKNKLWEIYNLIKEPDDAKVEIVEDEPTHIFNVDAINKCRAYFESLADPHPMKKMDK